MSTSAAGGAPLSSADDRVYRAVAAGASVDEVRRAIERYRSLASVDQAGANGETPLRAARRLQRYDLLCLLLENGAEAGDGDWFWAVCWCVERNDLAGLRRLIERGVSVDTTGGHGGTPLIIAIIYSQATITNRRDLTLEIFRRSSAKTRRAVNKYDGKSALDYIYWDFHSQIQPWQAELIGELLSAGAPVQPRNAPYVMPIAAAHAARREAELAALPPLAHDWRAHEALVGLALDVRELRDAERELLERCARLAVLELELGGGTGSSGGSEGASKSESESESGEGEVAGSGGGGGE